MVKVTSGMSAAFEFACHSSACRPPTSGGTGGSSSSGKKGGGDDDDYYNSTARLIEEAAEASYNRYRLPSTPSPKKVTMMSGAKARATMNRLAQKKDRTPAEEAQLKAAVARSRQSGSRTPTGNDRVKIRK